MAFELSMLKPLKLSDIPDEATILAAGKHVISRTPSWKQGKTYHQHTVSPVKTLSAPKRKQDGAPWHCRVSVHASSQGTFDEMWERLGASDKAERDQEYIKELIKVIEVKRLSPAMCIWSLHYHFPPPVAARVFTVLQVVHLEEGTSRTGTVISIPIDLSGEEDLSHTEGNSVKGKYTSVEQISELEDGTVEWRMATSSHPGGAIPTFIVEASLAGKIAEDIPAFFKWLESSRQATA